MAENDNGHWRIFIVIIEEGFGAVANKTGSAGEVYRITRIAEAWSNRDKRRRPRGASSVIWAVRSARVFNFMTPTEAAKLGLSEDERRTHIKIVETAKPTWHRFPDRRNG